MSVNAETVPSVTAAVPTEGAGPVDELRCGLERVLAFRYLILALMAAAAAVVAGGRGDWNVFVDAGRAMVGHDGFAVFVRHQDIQTGPLSLLVAWALSITPRNGFFVQAVLCGVLGLVAIRAAEQSVQFDPSTDPTAARKAHIKTLIGGLVVVFWWAKLGGYGHLDDAAVLAAAAVGLRQVRRGRPLSAAVVIGLSIAVKPWAVIFLPITLMSAGRPVERRRGRFAPLLAGLAAGAVPWAPFFIAQPATLHSIKATVKVAADSVIQLFGFSDANLPAWLRVAQLGGALALGVIVARRRGPAGVLLAVVAVRMATDPGTWSYYTAGFVLSALIWDQCESAAPSIPWATLAATVLLLPPWIDQAPEARAVLRLIACASAIVLTVSGRARPAGRSRPNPDRPATG